jgi:hypothetical protein
MHDLNRWLAFCRAKGMEVSSNLYTFSFSFPFVELVSVGLIRMILCHIATKLLLPRSMDISPLC